MVFNTLRRAKRKRVTADLQDFFTFPSDEAYGGPFRKNVKSFLERHARVTAPLEPYLQAWRLSLRLGGSDAAAAEVVLHVVEEDVTRSNSVYCDECRVHGWGDHPVSGKRYHFIIRNGSDLSPRYNRTCAYCRTALQPLDIRCTSCDAEITDESIEYSFLGLEDGTHLLHGVVHTNGFGHLLTVNGRGGGSLLLTGHDIMDFWDRLCRTLSVRKVTVTDASKKYGVDYRLLHTVTAGHSWYGNWGHELGAASFALTQEAYQKAVDSLPSTTLSSVLSRTRSPCTQLRVIIASYQSIANHQLVTTRDIFILLTQLLHSTCWPTVEKEAPDNQTGTDDAHCTWANGEVEQAEMTLIRVLQAVGRSQWVTWRTLKAATCWTMSPQLFDYCLKGLSSKATDGVTVAGRYNATASATEYRLEPVSSRPVQAKISSRPCTDHILHDLKFLYDALLNPFAMELYKSEAVLSSAKVLLDCKQFIKHYDRNFFPQVASNPFAVLVWCQIEMVQKMLPQEPLILPDNPPFEGPRIDAPRHHEILPQEPLILPINATVNDLKIEAARAFQEMYPVLQGFKAQQLPDYGNVGGDIQIQLLMGSEGFARIRGSCHGCRRRFGHFQAQRGSEEWIVDCPCGTKDDDGERMMACDACGVWMHTRCSGIKDSEDVPANFVCHPCLQRPRAHETGGIESEVNIATCSDKPRKESFGKESKEEMPCFQKPRRGRGRPRKYPAAEIGKEEGMPCSKKPRGRGRPRKYPAAGIEKECKKEKPCFHKPTGCGKTMKYPAAAAIVKECKEEGKECKEEMSCFHKTTDCRKRMKYSAAAIGIECKEEGKECKEEMPCFYKYSAAAIGMECKEEGIECKEDKPCFHKPRGPGRPMKYPAAGMECKEEMELIPQGGCRYVDFVQ